MQMSLVMNMRGVFSAMIEMKQHIHHVFVLWQSDVISLESRPLIFAYAYTHTQSIQKQIVEYDIKSKYSEYSTVDKVGR